MLFLSVRERVKSSMTRTRFQPGSPDFYVDIYRKMFFNGQKCLIIPDSVANRTGVSEAFNQWWKHIAACGANRYDTENAEQAICSDAPEHSGPHWGGRYIEIDTNSKIAIDESLGRALEQESHLGQFPG